MVKQQIGFMIVADMKNKLNKYNMKILILIVSIFFNSCSNKPKEVSLNQDNKIDSLTIGWQKDSLGCDNFRNKDVSERIIKEFKLEKSDEKIFLNTFGKPNKTIKRNNFKIICYYFNSMCFNSQNVEDSDYCVVEFTFKESNLVKRNYICI